MKIAIDARFFGPEGTGIGKYTEKLLENLEEIDHENQYFVILKKSNFHLFNPKGENFEKIMVDAHWYSPKEQVFVPAVLTRIGPDLVHFPHFNIPFLYPGKVVVTIHDLTMSEFKGASSTIRSKPVYLFKRAVYELTINQAIKRARRIFAPSNFTKNKLIKRFSLNSEKIIVTYEAADDVFVRAGREKVTEGREKQILATYGIKKPFILYVGNAYPFKNLDRLLEALSFVGKNVKLVYAASRNVFVDRLMQKAKEVGVSDRVVLTGFVPIEDLATLYRLAEAFVFPSLAEGFGLSGLEAMACGCPVICSNINVLKEVYGQAATFFNPKKPKEIADKIQLIMKNEELKIKQKKLGFEQVKKYSWKKLAEETLAGYKLAR
jgi:glycosyltransferase involved in cell wall biosynthesis